MNIRPYRDSDRETLKDITREAFQGVSIEQYIEHRFGMVAGHDWRWRKARHIDDDVASAQAAVWVAEDGRGAVVGYITTRIDTAAGVGLIPNMAVRATARGEGIGRRLIEHALAQFRAAGLELARIETLDQNAVGQHLYPACGFTEIARQIHYALRLKPGKEKGADMNADELRGLQAPLKTRYREEPAAARITLRAQGALDAQHITCRVDTGKALIEAGLHPATGGDGLAACSGDMLLEALVACAGVTLRAVATALDIPIRGGTVTAEGDLDFRGTLGVSKEAPVGMQAIRLHFDLDSDATPEQVATLLKLTERYCVVYQTLQKPPACTVTHRTGRM
jgi:ribosomal protein S18 acetylase RimI-like enzyme/uncharacterized OsmC-like protein